MEKILLSVLKYKFIHLILNIIITFIYSTTLIILLDWQINNFFALETKCCLLFVIFYKKKVFTMALKDNVCLYIMYACIYVKL